jgi:hypothetical protein
VAESLLVTWCKLKHTARNWKGTDPSVIRAIEPKALTGFYLRVKMTLVLLLKSKEIKDEIICVLVQSE